MNRFFVDIVSGTNADGIKHVILSISLFFQRRANIYKSYPALSVNYAGAIVVE